MTHRPTRTRQLIGLGAIALLAIGLTGCSKASSSEGGDKGGVVTLRISTWYEDKLMEPALEAANKQLAASGAKLESIRVPLDQYNTWLSTQLASGEGPDIIMDGTNFPARIKAGNLADVSASPAVANFNDQGLALTKDASGKVYGLPTYGWFSAFFYNKDLFAKHGVKVPTSLDEMIEAGKKFTAAGVQPLAMGLAANGDKAWHSLDGYLENAYYHNGAGSEKLDTDLAYGKAKLTGNWNEPVKKWYRMVEGGLITKQMLGLNETQAQNAFISGKAAMTITGPWSYEEFKAGGFKMGVFPFVGDGQGDRWVLGGPAGSVGVNKNSKHQDLAVKAFEALSSKEVQQAFLDGNPGGISYFKGLQADLPEEYAEVADTLSKGNITFVANRWGVNMPSQSMIDNGIKDLQKIITGKMTPDQFVTNMDKLADSVRY